MQGGDTPSRNTCAPSDFLIRHYLAVLGKTIQGLSCAPRKSQQPATMQGIFLISKGLIINEVIKPKMMMLFDDLYK